MTEVISVRFKSCGKNYFFDPAGVVVNKGERVIVETAKGLEMAECTYGNHSVEDTAVVQPLRPVVRKASEYDLKSAEQSKAREKEAFGVCRTKIEEHGLDMKLVDVECSFDGSKTTFFFTSDGRVDFRELVKDLAGVFHNRIELRQIGVRDEAKMIGGIGICGRPYCCHQFLDEFAPVSTKMAKVQSLSLNPTKISGSCGRLMCCLRYEEEAYEDLLTKVPKQGAYVETADGYGVATQINLLRQTVKVSLDKDSDETVHLYKASEIAVVPGGRPKEGEEAPHVLEEKIKTAEEQPDEDEEQIKTLFSNGRIYGFADNKLPENANPQQDSYHKDFQEKVQNSRTEQPEAQEKSDPANGSAGEASAKKSGSHRRYNKKRRNRGNNSEEVRQNGKAPETDKDIKSQKESSRSKTEKKESRAKSGENAEKIPGDNTKGSNKSSGSSRNRAQKGHSTPKNESKNTAPEKPAVNREPTAEHHENSEKKQPQKNNHNYRKKYYRKPRSNGAPKTDSNKAQPKQNIG